MNIHRRFCRWHGLGWDALLLLARVCLGATFWMSGQTKVEGWQLTASALYLFQEEYRRRCWILLLRQARQLSPSTCCRCCCYWAWGLVLPLPVYWRWPW